MSVLSEWQNVLLELPTALLEYLIFLKSLSNYQHTACGRVMGNEELANVGLIYNLY